MRWDIADCPRVAGYAIFEAKSGEEAFALYKSGMTIDLVFTDISLGGIASGWEAAKRKAHLELISESCEGPGAEFVGGGAPVRN